MSKKMRNILLICCAVLLCVFSYCAYKLVSTLVHYKQSEKYYSNLSNQYVSTVDPTAIKPTVDENKEKEEEDPLDAEISPIQVDFHTLQQESNNEVVAWIYGPDTVINYPIAHTENNSYYLNHLFNGNWNYGGTLFIEYINNTDFSDMNTIIYGHNMNDGSMFASLRNYTYQEYYDSHPKLYINTPTQNYRVEVFAAYITTAASDIYTINMDDREGFLPFIDKLKSLSDIKTPVTFEKDDRIVTFSTCTYEYDNARFVVQGKLVPIH